MVVPTTTALRASYTALSHADRRRLLLRLGVSESTLYRRLRHPADWTLYEVAVLHHHLGLSMDDLESLLSEVDTGTV